MATFVDFPVRPHSHHRPTLRAVFDRRIKAGTQHFRTLSSSAAALLGVDHGDRFEVERASLFETATPERR